MTYSERRKQAPTSNFSQRRQNALKYGQEFLTTKYEDRPKDAPVKSNFSPTMQAGIADNLNSKLNSRAEMQGLIRNIQSPITSPMNKLEARTELNKKGITLTEPKPKQTLGQRWVEGMRQGAEDTYNLITNPFETVDRIAKRTDEGITKVVESVPAVDFTIKNLGAGIAQANRNTLGTLEAIGLPKDSFLTIRRAADTSINKANEVNKNAGYGGQLAAQVLQSAPNALSQVGLALASGGSSIPAQLGKTTLAQGAKTLLTSPMFTNSMAQSFGGAYNQAIEDGAEKPQAIQKALLQAFPQALIEQAGGLETISAKLANKTKGLVGTALASAIEEGLEELVQYPFEGLAKKATYAPETKLFSTDESAVINPKEMGQNALVGGIAGGLLGGGSKVINIVQNPQAKPLPSLPVQNAQNNTVEPLPSLNNTDSTMQPQMQQEALQQAVPQPSQQVINTVDAVLPNFQTFAGEQGKGPQKERGFSQNVATDSNMNPEVQQAFQDDPMFYNQLTNKQTLDEATQRFNAKPFDDMVNDFFDGVDKFNVSDIPLARMIANRAAETGNMKLANQAIAVVSEKLTDAGRYSQAAAILRNANDPTAVLEAVKKSIRSLNKQGAEVYGKKWAEVNLTDAETKAIFETRGADGKINREAHDAVLESIHKRIAQELPSTNLEKFNAWRRTAMLLNPKTHVRNIVSNVAMQVTSAVKDTQAAFFESFIPKDQRTKALFWKSDPARVSEVNKAWESSKTDLVDINKYDLDKLSGFRDKRIFKTNALEKTTKATADLLNKGDVPFMEAAFKRALGMEMKAKGNNTVTDAMVENAKQVSLENTFKQLNSISMAIRNLKKRGGVVGTITEAAIPFERTPAAIAKIGLEYSPFGFVTSIMDAAKGKDASKVINGLSKALVGSELMALGMWLASLGLARGQKEKSAKAEEVRTNFEGEQPFSWLTPWGSFTYDFLQPVAMPFAMGAVFGEALMKNDKLDPAVVLDSFAAGGDTMFNMSMLQNIKKLFGGGYGSTTMGIADIGLDYIEQAWPSLFGQVAKSIDPVRRQVYGDNIFETWANSIKSKTPFLSKTLEPKLDVFGNEQSQGGMLQQFLSPGFTKAKPEDAVSVELARVFNSEKNTDLLPKFAPKSFSKDKKDYILTPKELTAFQREMGQNNYNQIEKLINSSEYKNASDSQKAKMIKRIVDKNDDRQKLQYLREKQ